MTIGSAIGGYVGASVGSVVGGGGVLSELVGIFSGGAAFTASRYTVDGGTGKVRSFSCHVDPSHVLDQAAGASQVAVPAVHADFAGEQCATFSGAQYYQSSQPAAWWKPVTDGTGVSVYLVLTPTDISVQTSWFGNYDGNVANGPGLVVYNPAAALGIFRGANGSGQTLLRSAAIAAGVPIQASVVNASSRSPNVSVKFTGSVESSGAYDNAPNSTDPPRTFELGRNGISNFGRLRWWGLFVAFTDHTPSERAHVQELIAAATGVSA